MMAFQKQNRAPIIAVYAPDGAGKSTLIDALERLLGPFFASTVRWHHLHRQLDAGTRVEVSRPHDQSVRSRGASLVKIAYYLARAWTRRHPQIVRQSRAGAMVIIDRDICDPALDPKRYRMNAPEWALSVLIRFGPKPDLAFVLDADSGVILRRSDELTAQALDRLRERYRRFSREASFVVLLDANVDAEKVAEEAVRVASARGLVPSTPKRPLPSGPHL